MLSFRDGYPGDNSDGYQQNYDQGCTGRSDKRVDHGKKGPLCCRNDPYRHNSHAHGMVCSHAACSPALISIPIPALSEPEGMPNGRYILIFRFLLHRKSEEELWYHPVNHRKGKLAKSMKRDRYRKVAGLRAGALLPMYYPKKHMKTNRSIMIY